MDNQLIRKILGEAITNTSNSSEQISDKVNAASAIFTANTLEGLSSQIKQLRNSINNGVGKVEESNKRLIESTDKHSFAMRWLTFALVIAALLQAFVSFDSNFLGV